MNKDKYDFYCTNCMDEKVVAQAVDGELITKPCPYCTVEDKTEELKEIIQD